MSENKMSRNSFFKMPKILFTDEVYQPLSTEAKVLYALLNDRKQLSKKNNYQNQVGEPFVFMTIEETCLRLRCGHEKACRLFKELEHFGLIFRESQGFGRAVKIYPVDVF